MLVVMREYYIKVAAATMHLLILQFNNGPCYLKGVYFKGGKHKRRHIQYGPLTGLVSQPSGSLCWHNLYSNVQGGDPI